MLAELSPEQAEQVTQGAKEFPFDAVLDVLNSKHSYEDKVSRILAISGTWMNAALGLPANRGHVVELPSG